MTQLRKRLTYANVMSSIAVFLVLGGATALAAGLAKNSVGSKQLKKNAVTTAKIKNGAVTASKVNVTGFPKVPSAVSADNATHANSADNANHATSADKATTAGSVPDGSITSAKLAPGAVTTQNIGGAELIPRGYAFVGVGGEVDPEFSVNIPDATHPSSGVYCFTLGFAPKHAQVTVEGDSEPNDMGSVIVAGPGETLTACPAGSNLEVETWDTQFNEFSSEEFFVVVW